MPPVDERVLRARLTTVHRELTVALKKQDWSAMARIDLQLRECLQEFATLNEPGAALLQIRTQLQRLHDTATAACREECEKLRQILQAHLTYAEGRSAYSQVALHQDE